MKTLLAAALFTLTILGCASSKDRLGFAIFEEKNRIPSDDYFLVTLTQWPTSYAYLSTLSGKIVKKWRIDRMAATSRLSPNGLLFAMMLIPEDQRKIYSFSESDEIAAFDQSGNRVLSIRRPNMSHDFDFVGKDQIVVYDLERINRREMQQFIPGTKLEFGYADRITVLDFSGKEIWAWSVKDHLKHLRLSSKRVEKTIVSTGNSLQYIESNPITQKPAILASFRLLNLVTLIEYPTGKVLWQTAPDELHRQHDAYMMGTRVMVFDNNLFDEIPNLYVKEWDIVTNKFTYVWHPPWWTPITTSVMGGARRLSNGSVLVSNSVSGNLFEVDSKGKVVWSYFFTPPEWLKPAPIMPAGFYRAEVYTKREIEDRLKIR